METGVFQSRENYIVNTHILYRHIQKGQQKIHANCTHTNTYSIHAYLKMRQLIDSNIQKTIYNREGKLNQIQSKQCYSGALVKDN